MYDQLRFPPDLPSDKLRWPLQHMTRLGRAHAGAAKMGPWPSK